MQESNREWMRVTHVIDGIINAFRFITATGRPGTREGHAPRKMRPAGIGNRAVVELGMLAELERRKSLAYLNVSRNQIVR